MRSLIPGCARKKQKIKMDLLAVDNLSITYRTHRGCLTAVDQVSFTLARGRCLGLVGESGSGKSTIGVAMLGLLPSNAEVVSGRICLEGRDLRQLPPEEMRQIRWKKIAMIFQAAMNSLNPLQRVEDQILEAIWTHAPQTTTEEARSRVAELFDQVGIPARRRRDYPHQYSGGMRQRAVIAMALACRPALVIADEPTTALDVIVQDQILKVLQQLRNKEGLSILLISNDIAVVADVCDDIGVLYAGQLVELGSRREVFEAPAHPYTKALLNAHITLAGPKSRPAAPTGQRAGSAVYAKGCLFCECCSEACSACQEQMPAWKPLSDTHHVRCCQER
jgi:peptide/nickel transport system ATP-binding protein